MDSNFNGIVDDGAELFGEGTRLIEQGELAANGFIGLAQYDQITLGGNDDGYITPDDEIWEVLTLWLDANADGISTLDEMVPLSDFGISSLDTIPKENNRMDSAGNYLPLWSWAVDDKKKYKMVDVFFKVLGT